ncbi:molybdopterin converting factor subunit 1 [Hyphomicrobiales bacterium]|jgi:molybdopterin synthase sulfur carrier subunit|nr:molybdopterin converting factor subunit 1 [Rhodobiaceae bacterium]MBT6223436.1 molybdopterin converting factor subunit 1 [Rhodobiaceae bacterium]MDB4831966.1 molybdopterin converting factor subunit 1 [Hyphomicrobiales bacterium]MDC0139242.1 molybdopterin converting factor subunit 1 [Hyphomicrobiales bacterium]|tara:strand:- start:132 stop:383 length:252 start_codon:yes stop_codon:yes gene_type:complete
MKLKYFAWVKEILGKDEENIDIPIGIKTLGDLIDWLVSEDEAFVEVFKNRELVKAAIDLELQDYSCSIENAKEIAFFPPVTGG